MQRAPRDTSNAPAATNREQPEPIYVGEAGRLLSPFRDCVNGLIESVGSFLQGYGVSVAKATIWKFSSREDPTYYEYVVTFLNYEDPVKLIGCADDLPEFVGEWRRRQPTGVQEYFADRVSIELLPLGLE